MKFAIVVLACVLAAAHAQYNRPNSPFGFGQSNNQYNNRFNPYNRFNQNKYSTPSPYRTTPTAVPFTFPQVAVTTSRPVVASVAAKVSSDAQSASVLSERNEINPDGSFNYFYQTSNGIAAQAQGTPRNFGGNPPVISNVIEGSFSWISPEGQDVSITYVADENGYQPQGNALPTPHPIPPQIARALEHIARTSPTK